MMSSITNNTSNFEAGGIVVGRNTIIDKCNISNNHSNRSGGGIYNILPSLLLEINNSTISYNTCDANGGGIFISCFLSIINSTIAHNESVLGGGCFLSTQQTNLINVTIANNNSNIGGGIYSNFNNIVTINNTIVANNKATDSNPDVVGNFTGSNNNLIGIVAGAIGFDPINGNIIGVDPMLGPLFNYGGFTQTMALLPDSPAIDSGDSGLVPSNILYDQRGFPFNRFLGTSVDIGAYEFNDFVICVSGDSIVFAKHILTNVIRYVQIKDIISSDYLVYNTITKSFIPIKFNIVTGKVNRFILLEKDVLGTDVPNQNIYIYYTRTHVIN